MTVSFFSLRMKLLVVLVFLTLSELVENHRCHYNVSAFFNHLRLRFKEAWAEEQRGLLLIIITFYNITTTSCVFVCNRIDKQWRQYIQYDDNGVTKDRVINNYSSSMGQLQHFFDNKGSSICRPFVSLHKVVLTT